MIDLELEEKTLPKAFLVGKDNLSELHGLVDTLGMEICGEMILVRPEPAPRYGIGNGKAEEIFHHAEAENADCIIFDFEISPTHQRNWEKLCKFPVFDRHEVILRIFAARARTKEAVLQVELAKLEYSLPRLAHTYGDLARQRGGSYGAKGSGETKLELDRRQVQEKMLRIKKELEKVKKERDTGRKRREKLPLPYCALVGYTNSGKSSLLNALTGAEVLVENKLFATLDPTTRRFSLPGGCGTLLTDTVGFISNLPHSLVDAFKSTLEEAARASLLLIVLDSTDPEVFFQYDTVMSVLEEIGADKVPSVIVLNKTDAVTEPLLTMRLLQRFPDAIQTSALTRSGFEKLTEAVCEKLLGSEKAYLIPIEKRHLVEEIRKNGIIYEELWQESSIYVRARAAEREASLLAQYETQ